MTANLLASDFNSVVWEFLLSGGVFMLLIVLCSLVAAAIVIHRLLSLRREAVMPRSLLKKLEGAYQSPGGVERDALRAEAIHSDTALGEIAGTALSADCETADEALNTTEAVAREEVLRLQSGLSILEDVITIAPLLGLLGTVSGLVSVFAELGNSTSAGADPKVLADGIARALNTTVAGLAVAVPTVVARTYFHKKIEAMAVRMEILFGRLIHARYRRESDVGTARRHEAEPEPEPPATPDATEKYQRRPTVAAVSGAGQGPLTPISSDFPLDELPSAAPVSTPAQSVVFPEQSQADPGDPPPQPGAPPSDPPPQRPSLDSRVGPQPIPPEGGHSQQSSPDKPAQ